MKSSFVPKILIVDDEKNIRRTLSICFETQGYKAVAVATKQEAMSLVNTEIFDLAFIDIKLGNDSGLKLVSEILSTAPWLKIVIITAYASIESAVEAMQKGAINYLPKPFSLDQVKAVTQKALLVRKMEQKLNSFSSNSSQNPPPILNSNSLEMRRAIELANQVANSDAAILITGPSGTGKTVLAKIIHDLSSRSEWPFVTIPGPSLSSNLLESELFGHAKGAFTGAIKDNPGKISLCENGTLFLDEISEIPIPIQPKLLRFLQDKTYERVGEANQRKANVRIISATNSDIKTAVKEGAFREDLLYRLNVIEISLPPLTSRKEDITLLAKAFLNHFTAQNHKKISDFSSETLDYLLSYDWPGNIRELRNAVERAVILSRTQIIQLSDMLPPTNLQLQQKPVKNQSLDQVEKEHIRNVISSSSSLGEAAAKLGINQATLWRKRKQYNLD